MLNKFINSEPSNEDDNLLIDFFELSNKAAFEEKWNNKIDQHEATEKSAKIIPFYKRYSRAVSAASMLLIVCLTGMLMLNKCMDISIGYGDSINGVTTKGISEKRQNLENILETKINITSSPNTTDMSNILDMYKSSQYNELLETTDNILVEKYGSVDALLFIAGVSAVKNKDYKKAEKYLLRISDKYSDYKIVLEILDNLPN